MTQLDDSNPTGNELDELIDEYIGFPKEYVDEFKSKLTKYIEQVIGEDDIQKPNEEDYQEWMVCDTCEVIIDPELKTYECNCVLRNALRAEQRAKLRGESNGR